MVLSLDKYTFTGFKSVGDGVEIGEFKALSVDMLSIPVILVCRFDSAQWNFSMHHFKILELPERFPAAKWREHLNVECVINAGQYYPDFQHMGWLISKGRNIGSAMHNRWKGVFAANPNSPELPKARIIDLHFEPLQFNKLNYKEAVQSIMLIDRYGKIRIQQTANKARRSVIAEEVNGRILVFVSQSDFTLWEFAQILLESPLKIKQAILLDGGAEAQLSMKLPDFEQTVPHFQIGIPAVISISKVKTDSRH